MKKILILAILACASIGLSENLTTVKGKIYFDITVVSNRCDLTGIYIQHKSGAIKLPFVELDKATQTKYGYDADKVAKIEQEKLNKELADISEKAKLEQERQKTLEVEQKEAREQLARDAKIEADKQAEKERLAQEQIEKTNKERATTLSYKGIYLRMTKQNIVDLINETEWDFKYNPDSNNELFFLDSNNKDFMTIGKKSNGDNAVRYMVDYVCLSFYKNLASEITLSSASVSASDIDSELKEWLGIAFTALKAKYGNPTKECKSIEDLNIFYFKDGFESYLYKWDLPFNQKVNIAVTTYESKFSGKINFVDGKIEDIKKDSTKIETNL